MYPETWSSAAEKMEMENDAAKESPGGAAATASEQRAGSAGSAGILFPAVAVLTLQKQ